MENSILVTPSYEKLLNLPEGMKITIEQKPNDGGVSSWDFNHYRVKDWRIEATLSMWAMDGRLYHYRVCENFKDHTKTGYHPVTFSDGPTGAEWLRVILGGNPQRKHIEVDFDSMQRSLISKIVMARDALSLVDRSSGCCQVLSE